MYRLKTCVESRAVTIVRVTNLFLLLKAETRVVEVARKIPVILSEPFKI